MLHSLTAFNPNHCVDSEHLGLLIFPHPFPHPGKNSSHSQIKKWDPTHCLLQIMLQIKLFHLPVPCLPCTTLINFASCLIPVHIILIHKSFQLFLWRFVASMFWPFSVSLKEKRFFFFFAVTLSQNMRVYSSINLVVFPRVLTVSSHQPLLQYTLAQILFWCPFSTLLQSLF